MPHPQRKGNTRQRHDVGGEVVGVVCGSLEGASAPPARGPVKRVNHTWTQRGGYEDIQSNFSSAAVHVLPHPCRGEGQGLESKGEQRDSLPNVLIIGDSISQGYMSSVQKALQGKANVLHNPGNGKYAEYGLKNLEKWLKKKDGCRETTFTSAKRTQPSWETLWPRESRRHLPGHNGPRFRNTVPGPGVTLCRPASSAGPRGGH